MIETVPSAKATMECIRLAFYLFWMRLSYQRHSGTDIIFVCTKSVINLVGLTSPDRETEHKYI